jgi:integrase
VLLSRCAVYTVNGEIKILRAAMNKAVGWGFEKEDPLKGVKFAKDLTADNKIKFLTEDEVERLLRKTKGTALHDVFATLYMTCIRREELVNLWWEDVVGELLGHSGPEITQISSHLVPRELGHVVGMQGRKGPGVHPSMGDDGPDQGSENGGRRVRTSAGAASGNRTNPG